MLRDLIESYRETKKFRQPTPATYKEEHPFLSEVDSMALCNAQLNLRLTLSRYLKDKKDRTKSNRKKTGFPKYKKRKTAKRSYTTNCGNNNIAIESGKIKLPKLGLVETVFHRRVEGKIKSATVSQDPSGKFFVSVLTEQTDPPEYKADLDNVVGLDFSFHDLIVTSDGARPKYQHWFRLTERKLSKAQRRLSQCTLGSQGYYKQKLKVALVHEKIANKRLDFLRKLAKSITDRYDVIVVEDIDLAGMAAKGVKRRFGKAVMDLGFGIFRTLLKNNCESRGKLYVVANRWFPSSQLCSKCGYRNKDTKDLSIRTWTCPQCGTEHDRDVNAAQNLVNWYRNNTGAPPEIYAEGDAAPTLSPGKSKQRRGFRKSCRTVDPASPSLQGRVG
jgi:putative transposase